MTPTCDAFNRTSIYKKTVEHLVGIIESIYRYVVQSHDHLDNMTPQLYNTFHVY